MNKGIAFKQALTYLKIPIDIILHAALTKLLMVSISFDTYDDMHKCYNTRADQMSGLSWTLTGRI